MKITKSYLKKIIQEELSKLEELSFSNNYINAAKNDAISAGLTNEIDQETYNNISRQLSSATTTDDIKLAFGSPNLAVKKALLARYGKKLKFAGIS
jgi:hypothetical protein